LDALLKLKPPNAEGRHLRAAMIADGRDKLLVFLTRRDVEPTNNAGADPTTFCDFQKITNGFRSDWVPKPMPIFAPL